MCVNVCVCMSWLCSCAMLGFLSASALFLVSVYVMLGGIGSVTAFVSVCVSCIGECVCVSVVVFSVSCIVSVHVYVLGL